MGDFRCTKVCNCEAVIERNSGSSASSLMNDGKAEVKSGSPDTDFADALKMLFILPLSDEERAEGIRRRWRGI